MDLSKFGLSDDVRSQIQEHIDELTSKYNQAKDESIKNRKGKDDKISTLQKNLDDLLERLGLSDLSELDNLPDTKGMAEAKKQVEAQLKRLTKELETANSQLGEKDKALTDLRTNSALKEAMSKHQFIDNELVELMVKQKLTIDGDDVLYSDDKGAMLSLSDALAGIAKAKPHLLKAPANGGSGFVANGGGGKAENPFQTGNLTEQIRLQAENPALAEQLKQTLN
jgi:DNA repair exonuclease SbcCD ATPase subunit